MLVFLDHLCSNHETLTNHSLTVDSVQGHALLAQNLWRLLILSSLRSLLWPIALSSPFCVLLPETGGSSQLGQPRVTLVKYAVHDVHDGAARVKRLTCLPWGAPSLMLITKRWLIRLQEDLAEALSKIVVDFQVRLNFVQSTLRQLSTVVVYSHVVSSLYVSVACVWLLVMVVMVLASIHHLVLL